MARKMSATENNKITKAKNAPAKENYKAGQFSDKTYAIAKKQGAIKFVDNVPAAKTSKDKKTLTTIQQNRKNDLSKTAGRASLIETMAKKKKAAALKTKKKTLG